MLSVVELVPSEVIAQMTVADIFFVHQRGAVNTIYVWTSAIGGTLAPVAAGYMTTNEGWRWVWWWCAIWFAVCIVLFVFGYEETRYSYPSTLTGLSSNAHNESRAESEKTPDDSKVPSEKIKEAGILTNSTSQTPEKGLTPSLTTGVIITTSIPIKAYRQKLSLWTTSSARTNPLHHPRHLLHVPRLRRHQRLASNHGNHPLKHNDLQL
jgi:MFS family permease